ncbi:MAG TPA: hypothetical protein VK557_13100, partial [Pyrinomonadaceae bacterium]|nr:hypothetical protein [Pyrinomonadaceae bacterium]
MNLECGDLSPLWKLPLPLGEGRGEGQSYGTESHFSFNLLEEFHGYPLYDQHVVSYLELMKQPYTGCNPRGL